MTRYQFFGREKVHIYHNHKLVGLSYTCLLFVMYLSISHIYNGWAIYIKITSEV